jgi:hypothetical protein
MDRSLKNTEMLLTEEACERGSRRTADGEAGAGGLLPGGSTLEKCN